VIIESGSASAKVFASDTAFKVCNQAMELMGDHGYLHSHGAERGVARLPSDADIRRHESNQSAGAV